MVSEKFANSLEGDQGRELLLPPTPGLEGTGMDLEEIKEVLPHRDPFLLVDKVVARDGLRAGWGEKKLSGEEFYFQNHFEGRPQVPKSVLVEIMAQAGAACVLSAPEYRDKLLLFASIEECDFGRPPVPGELLELRVETRGLRRGMGKMRAQCWVGSELLADGLLMFALADK